MMEASEQTYITPEEIQQASAFIQGKTKHRPAIGLILGSGLGSLADDIEQADIIPYAQIPYFPHASAPSHAGRLVIGNLMGKTIVAMQGRTHYYEGYGMQQITMPIRIMQLLGVKTLVITNAAGGINQSFEKGDLMLITGHLNLLGIKGPTPLRGPNLDDLGPRFPNMTQPYAPKLISLAHQAVADLDFSLREGVYAQWAGPAFESPAEIRYLKILGADAVGMSTVPETIVANHGGMQVLGISSITNLAIHQTNSGLETTAEEVWETVKIIIPKLTALVKGILTILEIDPPETVD